MDWNDKGSNKDEAQDKEFQCDLKARVHRLEENEKLNAKVVKYEMISTLNNFQFWK